MKRFSIYIICCSLLALFACAHDDIELPQGPVGNGKITIKPSLDNMVITRATVADSEKERTITHIDVFAVNASTGSIAYYERSTVGNNNGSAVDGAGSLVLNVARRAKDANNQDIFAPGEEYSFYLVANSTLDTDDLAAVTKLTELQVLVQDDSFDPEFVTGGNVGGPSHDRQTLLHLSGTDLGKNDNFDTPQTFLMDATATDATNLTKWVVNPASGSVSDLVLAAEFKRAAAKIIVNITQGPDVEFRAELKDEETDIVEGAQYDFYKLPCSTFLLSSQSKLVDIRLINTAPMKPNDKTFVWASETGAATNSIQVVGYAYAHKWSDIELTNETSLILNIPMMWNEDDDDNHTKESVAARSWYKVPLSQAKSFERNKCYMVNIEINATGAKTKSTAIQLRDIEYKTLDWVGVDLSVGENVNDPEYLMLNTDLVEMYNTNFDSSSLKFSSSSPIVSVTLKDVYAHDVEGNTFTSATDTYSAYFVNKFNNKMALDNTILKTISASADENVLEGGISIISPIVPASSAEINQQIKDALGDPPAAPTLTAPTYSGEIPTEPTVVPAASEPNPNDYVKAQTTPNGDWPNNWQSTTYYNATGGEVNKLKDAYKRVRVRTGTESVTEYRCVEKVEDGKRIYEFQKRTGTRNITETETSTRKSAGNNNNWDSITSTYTPNTENYDYSNWTSDTQTQNLWNSDLAAYTAYVQYLEDKAEYDADMAELNNDPAYKQYLTDKEEYERQWAQYNADLADYNTKADAIRAAADGDESHYNTIRYLEFVVTNQQGLTATFRVMQYPTIYITNVVGWYSYRDDFVNASYTSPATYEKQNSGIVKVGYSSYNSTTQKVTYTYGTGSSTSGYFWGSKVNTGKTTNQNYYNLGYYYWNNSTVTSSITSSTSLRNARMYYVRVTSTSSDYVVGRPKLVKLDDNGNKVEVTADEVEIGFTDDTEVNAQLVSPSFMLASQLGYFEVSNFGNISRDVRHIVARDHCKNYVEVTTDGTHLKNWRLPTQAEIKIIISLQSSGTNDNYAAIDQVLTATSYYASNGEISATTGEKVTTSSSQPAVRCVRDAY